MQQTGAIAMQGVDAAGDGASAQVRGAARRASRRALGLGVFPLKSSPLTRRIITFNLIALNVLVAGILLLNASRESLVMQHASALIGEAELIANVFEVQSAARGAESLTPFEVARALDGLSLRNGVEVYVFDAGGSLAGHTEGTNQSGALTALAPDRAGKTPILDGLGLVWTHGVRSVIPAGDADAPTLETQLRALIPATLRRGTQVETGLDTAGGTVFSASTPIRHGEAAIGVVAVATPSGEIDAMVRGERERVLQMFLVAALVSVGLSLVLASTIANPLADLAEAAETGRERNAGKIRPGRIRIPDLSGRPDEIGRLSRAMRGMVSALYNRIDANEQFAADVAHEIKNPLASLRSAVGTMRMVTREDQRNRLLGVIEHDVRRLDRLVSDISNASRLDAELVKEDEKEFDLLAMLATLNQYLGADAEARGIDYITDMPHPGARGAARAGLRQPDHQRDLVQRDRRRDPGLGAPAQGPGAGGDRGYRPRDPRRGPREDIPPRLFAAPGRAFRQQFRPGSRDLEADRRGPWWGDLGREHPPHRGRYPLGPAGRALRRRPAGLGRWPPATSRPGPRRRWSA